MDGTYLRVDTLHERLLYLLFRSPLQLLHCFAGLLHGKACLKERVARASLHAPASFPISESVSAFIEQARAEGRTICLATASEIQTANAVAQRGECFDSVFASDRSLNLKGRRKAEFLADKFADTGFDYIGDCAADIPVWKAARIAYVANARNGLMKTLTREGIDAQVLSRHEPMSLNLVIRLLRSHQWVKNVLIFAPLILGHAYSDTVKASAALISFLLFCATASGIYIVNDLLDLDADRQHPTKRGRPIASGRVSALLATVIGFGLLAGSVVGAYLLVPKMLPAQGAYAALALSYSLFLKRKLILDAIILASLYSIRVYIGSVVTGIEISYWFLLFAIFIFFSLALVKRFTEIQSVSDSSGESVAGRSYLPKDLIVTGTLGISSGLISILVFAQYIASDKVSTLYQRPEALWLGCPLLLYWIARLWTLAYRGDVHEDPVVFAIKDRMSYGLAIAIAVILYLAQPI